MKGFMLHSASLVRASVNNNNRTTTTTAVLFRMTIFTVYLPTISRAILGRQVCGYLKKEQIQELQRYGIIGYDE